MGVTAALGLGGLVTVANSAGFWSSTEKNELKSELINTYLNLEQLDVNLYRSHHLITGLKTSPNVFGGQVIGQALMAANETVPDEFIPNSLYSFFILPGSQKKPILYNVERIRDGRSYVNRTVKAVQNGQTIFTCEVSFHKEETCPIKHQSVMPQVPPPEELKNTKELLTSLSKDERQSDLNRKWWEFRLDNVPSTIEMRPVNPEEYLNLKASQPKLAMWVKTNQPFGDDHRLHYCVSAFVSDYSMISTAIMPHITRGIKIGMVTSLSHCMWFHRKDFRMDEWMLYETESTIAEGGRALIHGRLWTRDGKLVVSTAQEGVVRAARDGTKSLRRSERRGQSSQD